MFKILRNSLFCILLLISCEAKAVCYLVPVFLAGGFTSQWMCFPDPPPSDPALAGDVVGRDLNVPCCLGSLGHLGLWDGARVVEVVNGTANAIRLTTLSSFKSASTTYWGTASANIPTYDVYGCFSALCQNWWLAPQGQVETVRSRFAIAKRAYQAYLIGADYTLTAQYVRAWPGDGYYPAIRGSYRCDTFVLDMLYASIEGGAFGGYWDNYGANVDPTWKQRWNALSFTIAPRAIFDKLATYQ